MITSLNLINMATSIVRQVGYYLIPEITLLDNYSRWRKQAQILNLSRPARNRLDWFIYHQSQTKESVSLTCRHFGIAPKTFYKWQKVFDGKNLLLLEDRSRMPKKRRQRQITSIEEQRIIEIRKQHLRWGKIKLAKIYKNTYRETISSWKIQYTVKKYRLYFNPKKNEKLQKKRKRNQSKKRITELKKKPFPGFLICFDVIVVYWNGLKRYILTAIDSVSKIPFARMYTSKSSRNAADFINRVFYLLDGSLLNALHDNGSEFHKEFIASCKKLGIDQYWSRAHTPTDNSINERFNRTLKEEFIALGNFNPDPVQFNQKLTEWLIEYTFIRPHQALGYSTPWEFYQKTAKVLPMYSSCTHP